MSTGYIVALILAVALVGVGVTHGKDLVAAIKAGFAKLKAKFFNK